MRKHLFYFLLLFVVAINAQITPEIEWAKALGDSYSQTARDVVQTSDGGYLIGGYAEYAGDGDVGEGDELNFGDYWLVKLGSDGNIAWEKSYGGSSPDILVNISESIDGGYFLGGNSRSNNGDVGGHHGSPTRDDFWIVKIDEEGEIIWEKNLGGNYNDGLADGYATDDGGYIAVGYTQSNSGDVEGNHNAEGGADGDGWIVKLSAQGSLEWQKCWGGLGGTNFDAIEPTSDGGYILTGRTNALGGDVPNEHKGGSDLIVVKINESGNTEWSNLYGGSGSTDRGYSIKSVTDGGYIIAGATNSSDGDISNYKGGSFDVWVLKIDISGNLEWEKTYGGDGGELAYDIHLTEDCGYVIGGIYTNGAFEGQSNRGVGTQDLFLLGIDSEGEIRWVQTMGGSSNDILYKFIITSDSGYITAGDTRSVDGDVSGYHIDDFGYGGFDFWVVKLSPDCIVPEFTIVNPLSVCYGEDLTLTANTDGQTIRWYESEDATEPFFTGAELVLENITEGVSYWVEVANCQCISERVEVIVNVNPVPELVIEEEEVEICSGNDAHLYAFSEGNVIFWYENEEEEDYLYHGNNFIIEDLEEGTYTYWVEAYNMTTGCASERIPVTITVNPAPDAPVVIEVYIAEEGQTLADLEEDIEFEGTLTWYADEFLAVELPNTTMVEDHTVYFVTQTVNGCESEAAVIEVEFLGTSDINNSAFAYYPNPVKDKLYFTGKEKVQSVQIFDASGKLIINKESKANGIQQLDVTTLPKGTYIVKAQTDKELQTFKIVKQ